MLTAEERARCAVYLQRRAADQELLVPQLEKMGQHAEFIRRQRIEVAAMRLVSQLLASIETQEGG